MHDRLHTVENDLIASNAALKAKNDPKERGNKDFGKNKDVIII